MYLLKCLKETFMKKILALICFSFIFGQYYNVELDGTGEYQIIIFRDTITSLDPGDEIGIFDANGVVETDSSGSNPSYGEVLVGAGVWTGSQTEISAIMSVDMSEFNGPILGGAIEDNPVIIKVWKASEEMEYIAGAEWEAGSGFFGDIILAASELTLQADMSYNVAVNEFFFRSASGTSVPDYVELVNFGDSDVDLTGWTLMGEELSGTISAGGYMLVTTDSPFYDADADLLFAGEDIPNSIALEDFNLGNSSDEIDLLDANGNEVDYVAYDPDAGWPVGSDYRGHAVELINPAQDNSDPLNWVSVGMDCMSDILYGEDGSDDDLTNFGSPTLDNCNWDGLEIDDYSIPTEYNLISAYPNPFNPTTTISYSMPISSKVKISIFDMLGREVAVLANEVKQMGNHSYVWDAADLPSGFYFITMTSNDFYTTQKVTLIK